MLAPAAAPVAPPTSQSPSAVVSNCDDSGPGSLRDAVATAADGDVIDLTELTCSTISLTSGAIVTGQPSLRLVGPGRELLTIDATASPGSSVFYHLGGGTFWLESFSVSHGSKYRNDNNARGGCVHAEGALVAAEVDFHDCTVTTTGSYAALGGAAFAGGFGIFQNSTISGNAAIARGNGYASGGGIYAYGGLAALVMTLADNDARSYSGTATFGGGAFTRGYASLGYSAIVRNHAKRVGGLALFDSSGHAQQIVNSTISENTAQYVGGVYSYDAITVENSTIANNIATYGAGTTYNAIGVGLHMGPFPLTVYSTLISGNTAFGQSGYDLAGESGATVVGSNNLIPLSELGVPSDTIRTAARLAAVADNGGLSPTQALLPGSPGIDAGRQPPSGPLAADQRGFGRWFGSGPDIGAFENQADYLLTTGFDFGPTAAPAGTFPPGESFDELIASAPSLPAGWSNVHVGVGGGWTLSESAFNSPPVAAFADDVNDVSDSSLVTPAFTVGPEDEVGFIHQFKLETDDDVTGYDGVVLEISIDGGAFEDIVQAGGSFIGAGYNRTLSDCCDNPLALRQAWSGDSGGFHAVVATFPPGTVGHSVRLRWRLATDSSDRVQGYWLDDLWVGIGPA